MTVTQKIRAIASEDISALKIVIEACDLFPANMLDEMISNYLEDENNHEFWFTCEDEKAISIGYCAPEKMTESTWNLYLIAVHPDYQGKGIGTAMLNYIEQILINNGERVLLVETSGLDSFAKTRNFYSKCGYQEEARIREFYQAGEDKIIFRKALNK